MRCMSTGLQGTHLEQKQRANGHTGLLKAGRSFNYLNTDNYKESQKQKTTILSLGVVCYIQDDSKLLPGFQLIGHENPDNNFESLCILELLCRSAMLCYVKIQHSLLTTHLMMDRGLKHVVNL
jgi:hypothetical protein